MTHLLKIKPEYFEEVLRGIKTFEVRKNDRGFKKNDILILQEYENNYTGREIQVWVSYLLENIEFGIEKEYCIMSIVVTNFKLKRNDNT